MKVEAVKEESVPTVTVSITKEDLLALKIQQSIKNIIKNEGFLDYSVTMKMFAPDGGSYLGILCEVDIKGEVAIGTKETNLFIKLIILNDQMSYISLPGVFERELLYYTELKTVFSEIQEEMNVPVEERFKIVKCFDESKPEVLIFENMSKRGYKTMNRKDIVTLEFAKLAIEQMAKFHSMSFVLEERRPKYFEQKIKGMSTPFNFDDDFRGYAQMTCRNVMDCLDDDKKTRLEDLIPKLIEKFQSFVTDNKNTKCCLCHGDFRPNNIMMKEIDGTIIELIPIDYQLIYLGCPVIDFLYFIFSCTDRTFRKAHLSDLKDHYHGTIMKFLKYFDLDVDVIYPRKEFEKAYKERMEYGLIAGLMVSPLLFADNDGIPDLTQPLAKIKFNIKDEAYNERIVGMVEDFIEWGYL